VNEVQTMAKVGETVGSAVGTAVGTALMTARQGAKAAGKNSAIASRRIARRTTRQAGRRLAEHGIDRAHLQDLQDNIAESVWRARHELASKIEPPTRRRMPNVRILLMIAAIGAIVGAIAAVMSRRPQPREAERERPIDGSAVSGGDVSGGETMPGDGAQRRQFETSPAGTARPAPTREASDGITS